MDYVRKTHSPYSRYMYRSLLTRLFESVLGEGKFSRRKFDRLVPTGPSFIMRLKVSPDREHVVEMVKVAIPLHRALVGVLATTGMRIGEALSRKWSELELTEDGHARIKLKASETKARYGRQIFLTKECVEFLQACRRKNSDWLFPSDGGSFSYNAAHSAAKQLFGRVGLVDKNDKSEIYTTYSFRTFAGDQMRECGLMEKFVLAIVGHKNKMLGAEASYLDWKKIETAWVEKCADKMQFLDTGEVVQKQVVELARTNGKLEALLEKLLERLT